MRSRSLFNLSLVSALVIIMFMIRSAAAEEEDAAAPANAPAVARWDAGGGRLSVRYHGAVILEATIRAEEAGGQEVGGLAVKLEPAETPGDKVEQRLKFLPVEPREGVELVLRGTVVASGEAFPAEEARGARQNRFPCVRNSVGLSHNLRNHAVYDRRWDWVLIGPGDGATRIRPKLIQEQRITFTWESRGPAVELVFRPLFYHKHKELEHFKPWAYKVWKGSLTGYCTWWAYRNGFSQTTLDAVVDVFAVKHLPDFGYGYIQLDDCYQIGNGNSPRGWLTWNDRWPGGPEYTLDRIRSAGMKPGIWVHRVHRSNGLDVQKIVTEHPDWFVKKPDGELFLDNGFYCLNTHNEEALEGMARVTYRALRKQGWAYVKIDGTGDLLWAYNKAPEFFEKIGKTPGETLRKWDVAAREELGPDVYLLACWGVHPSLNVVGLVDGCRLGSDGFGTGEFQRFNSWNGVVWRNDPDHCDILGEYYMDNDAVMPVFGAKAPVPMRTIIRPALCTLAGGVLMVSDKVEVYRDDLNLEGMKRSAPVLFTVPGQLYDYSPRGRGDYHAGLHGGEASWWLLEIDRPFDHWSVLGRFQWGERQGEKHVWELEGAPEREVVLADLGLPDDREYLVFEFWSQQFLGKAKGSFTAPAMDDNTGLHVFAIREARGHPWVLSTTRHLSQGGVSLIDETWDASARVLSGKSAVVIGDPYVLTVHLPEGFRLESAEVGGEKAQVANKKETAAVRIVPSSTKTVECKMTFSGDAGRVGWDMGPFVKRKEPILRPTPDSRFHCPVRGKEVRWEEQNVYNPAAVVRNGKVHLLYRADDRSPDLRWGRTCRIGLAWSDDGVNFTRHGKPVLYPDNDPWREYEWEGGCEDLHIIEGEDGTYYMNYTTWSGTRDTMSVATSRDLYHWTKHGPAFRKAAPEQVHGSRTGVVLSRREGDRLIAAKVDGRYWMYYTHPCALAWSDTLIDWTPAGKAVWPGGGREAGAVALLRDDGILLMTQGGHPSLGAWVLRQALIDPGDLRTVLKEQTEPFLYPEYDWEKQGMTGRTTVSNGLVYFKNRWLLYYGAADRVIGLAVCSPETARAPAPAARPALARLALDRSRVTPGSTLQATHTFRSPGPGCDTTRGGRRGVLHRLRDARASGPPRRRP